MWESTRRRRCSHCHRGGHHHLEGRLKRGRRMWETRKADARIEQKKSWSLGLYRVVELDNKQHR